MEELLTVASADSLDLSYKHKFLPPELPLAAIRDSIHHLNILKIVIHSSNQFKVFDSDNCHTIIRQLTSQFPPLIYNQNNPHRSRSYRITKLFL